MYECAPLGTMTLLFTTIGASGEALKTSPAWFVFESMLSTVRTVTTVFAGTVTVTGCGAGGAAGAAAPAAGAGSAADAASRLLVGDDARLGFAGRAAGSGAGVAAGTANSGAAACAATTLI